ncbi:DUF1330 domain-containing protein [Novosphingobium lentum]|uniref:DUF1330 domain-containing protein n=1 Tax=Novosphingobium lentum TaxID=145287 RepID=UPI0008368C77|nr:DUF1330 domain-containing protein [Novosphingobium lentum]
MASYVLSMMNKHDLAKYGEYSAQGFVSLQGLPFEVIVGEGLDTLEGTAPGSSVVLMKFPDNDAAMAWYKSDAYQTAIPIRHQAAETIFAVHFTDDR